MDDWRSTTAGTAPRLVDSSRSGTLILGEFRSGSHFLHGLIEDAALNLGLAINPLGELDGGQPTDGAAVTINQLEADRDSYHIMILNQTQHKIAVLDNKCPLTNWHVIRLVIDDRRRWFISWLFHNYLKLHIKKTGTAAKYKGRDVWYVGTVDAGSYYDKESGAWIASWPDVAGNGSRVQSLAEMPDPWHHGVPESQYQSVLDQLHGVDTDTNFWVELVSGLRNCLITCTVPADIEVGYSQLASMQTHRRTWQPNHYPEIDLSRYFKHHELIESFLSRWQDPFPGAVKELV